MPRRLKLATDQKGDIEVMVVRSKDGVWEGDWQHLQGTPVGDLFSVVTQAEFDHVLHKFSKPFVDALGIPPEGALRKLPSTRCAKERGCTLYDSKRCFTHTKKELPWCFQLAEVQLPEAVMTLVTEVIFLWRTGAYLVVVEDDGRRR